MNISIHKRKYIMLGLAAAFLLCIPHVYAVDFAGAWSSFLNSIVAGAQIIILSGESLFFLTVKFTILEFSSYWNSTSEVGNIFKIIWQIIRDIVNLGITILFVLTALGTIIWDGFGLQRKTLLYLLAAAVLNNFSAFIALVLIDISNAIILFFYNYIIASDGSLYYHIAGEQIQATLAATSDGYLLWNTFTTIVIFILSIALFIILLLFCLNLLERFLYAIFLVAMSPIAVLGFFIEASTGGKSSSPLENFVLRYYTIWKESFNHVFASPIILLGGLYIGTQIFYAMIEKGTSYNASLEGVGAAGPEAFTLLITVSIAAMILVLVLIKTEGLARKQLKVLQRFGPKYLKENSLFRIGGRAVKGIARNTTIGRKIENGIRRQINSPTSIRRKARSERRKTVLLGERPVNISQDQGFRLAENIEKHNKIINEYKNVKGQLDEFKGLTKQEILNNYGQKDKYKMAVRAAFNRDSFDKLGESIEKARHDRSEENMKNVKNKSDELKNITKERREDIDKQLTTENVEKLIGEFENNNDDNNKNKKYNNLDKDQEEQLANIVNQIDKRNKNSAFGRNKQEEEQIIKDINRLNDSISKPNENQ